MESIPTLSAHTAAERRVCELQSLLTDKLRKSAYWVVEARKANGVCPSELVSIEYTDYLLPDLEHYSDRHRPELTAQPALKRKDLHEPFFPPDVFEGYFNPKKRRRMSALLYDRSFATDV